jgi:hypothetical protein
MVLDRTFLLPTWDSKSDDCCEWEGIGCSNQTAHVEMLDINGMQNGPFLGEINASLLELRHLKYFNLSWSQFSNSNFLDFLESSLKNLFLSDNLLHGRILKNFTFPQQLEILYLDSNNLEGVITDSHFDNMSMLMYLNLSYNSLALNFSENWAPPFQLSTIYLRTCIIGPSFPKWLQSQKYLNLLDISDTGISDLVPMWFWTLAANMMLMNISYNNLIGTIPNLPIRFSENQNLSGFQTSTRRVRSHCYIFLPWCINYIHFDIALCIAELFSYYRVPIF